jgi:hypothetical protein
MKIRRSISLWIAFFLTWIFFVFLGCERIDDAGRDKDVEPAIVTIDVTEIYSAGATLKVSLKPNRLPVKVTFEYGTSLNYSNTIEGIRDPSSDTGNRIMAKISSLKRDTVYHFRVKASNSAGTTFSDDRSFTARFGIGEEYAGGFIICLDDKGEHGLIAADTDQSTGTIWDNGTNCLKTSVNSITIGSGRSNTMRLVSVLGLGSYPARICDELVLNGYSDWFLPSLQELECLWKSLSVFDRKYNLNGFFYWTSSEEIVYDGTRVCNAWVLNILTGEQRTWPKDDNTPVFRAVRAF